VKRDKAASAAIKTRAHVLVLEARFYADLCDELARGAIAAIERAGATWERQAVPGALEIPGAIAVAAKAKRFDGYVALGCVLRGETTHYDIVANESARGIMDLTMTGLEQGSIYALVALGYTLVYGVLRLINFAHSEVFMIGTFTTMWTWGWMGFDQNTEMPMIGGASGEAGGRPNKAPSSSPTNGAITAEKVPTPE